jgi:hypothetical protein
MKRSSSREEPLDETGRSAGGGLDEHQRRHRRIGQAAAGRSDAETGDEERQRRRDTEKVVRKTRRTGNIPKQMDRPEDRSFGEAGRPVSLKNDS